MTCDKNMYNDVKILNSYHIYIPFGQGNRGKYEHDKES